MQFTVAIDEQSVFNDFTKKFNIAHKKVLEIGGKLVFEIVNKCKPKQWVAVDPRNENQVITERYFTNKGYAQILHYDDNYFDYIFSCNAFHHISYFESALLEMYRVLKPRGILFANFGPIWSAPDGSHIENVIYNKRKYNFWENNYIPDWYHLVYTPKELFEIIKSKVTKGLAEALVIYTYLDSWINRYSYFDYERIFKNSPFEVLLFGGCTDFGYVRPDFNYVNKYYEKFEKWLYKHKNDIDKYQLRDLKVCLKK